MAEIFQMITPITYWILIILWSFILSFYVKKMWDSKTKQLFHALVIILAIDAFRTLFESFYFGLWYTSLSGLIPLQIGTFLQRPELVIIPKIINVGAAVIIIVLLLKKWLPKEELEQNMLWTALEKSEEEFRALFEDNPVSCWIENLSEVQKRFEVLRQEGILDIDAYFNEYPEKLREFSQAIKIKDVNQATLELHNAENKEQLLQGLDKTFTPESFEIFRKEMVDLWNGKTQNSHDGFVKTLDGDLRYVQINYKIMTGYENTLEKVLISIVDNTKKWLIEEELSSQKKLFETMFNTIPDGVVITNTNREIQLANKGMEDTFGYKLDEILGKTTEILYAKKENFSQTGKAIYGNKSQKKGDRDITYYKNNNGLEFPCETFGAKLFDDNNRWLGNLGIMRDITERVRQEEEGEILQKQLSQAQKMEAIGTLAGGIAHDFNNILGVILGYTELAKDDCQPGSSISQDLTEVLTAVNRAKSLVRQILAFSRQDDTERMRLQPASIVKETIAMLRPSLPTTIEITQAIDAVTGLVFVDPTQLNQILMNLCTNAFHAMEDTGGKLDISLKEVTLSNEDLINESDVTGGTFIQLSIGDSGTGIAPDLKDKIFDPYFTTKDAGKGTGMGLSMVHGIVKNYGGFISLDSELGAGTIFHVFLPTVEQEALTENDINDQVPIGKERILFVDDEEILAQMGKTMLERLGYHVTVRSNSLEALETFQNQPDQFDIVITDQTMPGMTGGDLSRRMLQIRPDIPIILCTGYSTIVTEEKAKYMGIKAFAFKPLAKNDIAKMIRKVLDVS